MMNNNEQVFVIIEYDEKDWPRIHSDLSFQTAFEILENLLKSSRDPENINNHSPEKMLMEASKIENASIYHELKVMVMTAKTFSNLL